MVRPRRPSKYLLLALSIRSGIELGPTSFVDTLKLGQAGLLREHPSWRMRLERDYASLVKEGYGSFTWRRRAKGKGEKVFIPNNRGRLLHYLQEIDAVFQLSDSKDQDFILQ